MWQINGILRGWKESRTGCCTGTAKKASWPDALVDNCGCGVWLCGRSESNCHVAFPFRSQLPGEEHLFVCLPQTVTAWQLRFHQSREWGKNRVFGGNVQLCAFLQHACECVKYENLMKPTGGTWLQCVLPFILWGAVSSCSSKFRKKQKRLKKVLTFQPGCHQNWSSRNWMNYRLTRAFGREGGGGKNVKVTVMKSMARE